MVKLEIQKPSGCTVCSGSFIFTNWILTAGHCVEDADYLVVYPTIRNGVGYTINKTHIVTRTYMYASERRHDIALIKFPYNEPWGKIEPIRMPNALDPSSAYYGKQAFLSRFNSVCTGNITGLTVHLYLTIHKEESCTLGTRLLFLNIPLRDEHLCARTTYSKTCEPDTSGHLVLKDSNELVGILSQPKDKSCSELIFSRINYYTKFIELVTGIDLPGGGWNAEHNATITKKIIDV